jgi:alpha-tubulin suppressor-like RCC1 family protein
MGSDCGWVSDVLFTPDPPPTVRIEPHEQTIYEGEPAVLHAAITGATPAWYSWSADYYGEFTQSDTMKFFPFAADTPINSVMVTTDSGSTLTDTATVHVKRALVGQRAMVGQPVQMKLSSTEKPDSVYWIKDENQLTDTTNLHGCTTTYLRIAAAQASDAGIYNVNTYNTRSSWNSSSYANLKTLAKNPIIGWGFTEDNVYYGESPQEIYTTPDLRDAVAISTSRSFSLALMADGTVQFWGLGDFPTPDGPPDYLFDVKAIGAGDSYGIALKNDGTVQLWVAIPLFPGDEGTLPDTFTDITAISAGSGHYLGLKRNRTVVAGGGNDNGECDVPADLKDVVTIAAGGMHSLAVTKSGRVVAWGNNDYAQLMPPHGLGGVIAIAAGDQHSLALRSDGTVAAWGDNSYGQCAVPRGLKGVVAIAAGAIHSVALTATGQVVTWGGYYSQDQEIDSVSVPIGLRNVARIAAGGGHTVALIFAPTVVGIPQVTMFDNPAFSLIRVDVGGRGPFSYQWRVNGHSIPHANKATLTVQTPASAQQPAARFKYDVVVRNKYGSDISQAVTVPALDSGDSSFGSILQTFTGGGDVLMLPPPMPLQTAILPVAELTITRQNESLVLSWTMPGCILESTDAIEGPFSTSALLQPAMVNGTNQVTVPITSEQKFYRLRATSN